MEHPKVRNVKRRLRILAWENGKLSFRKLFKFYDRDNSGFLEWEEFLSAIRKSAKFSSAMVTDEELKILFDYIDANNDGRIEYKTEFLPFFERPKKDTKRKNLSPQKGNNNEMREEKASRKKNDADMAAKVTSSRDLSASISSQLQSKDYISAMPNLEPLWKAIGSASAELRLSAENWMDKYGAESVDDIARYDLVDDFMADIDLKPVQRLKATDFWRHYGQDAELQLEDGLSVVDYEVGTDGNGQYRDCVDVLTAMCFNELGSLSGGGPAQRDASTDDQPLSARDDISFGDLNSVPVSPLDLQWRDSPSWPCSPVQMSAAGTPAQGLGLLSSADPEPEPEAVRQNIRTLRESKMGDRGDDRKSSVTMNTDEGTAHAAMGSLTDLATALQQQASQAMRAASQAFKRTSEAETTLQKLVASRQAARKEAAKAPLPSLLLDRLQSMESMTANIGTSTRQVFDELESGMARAADVVIKARCRKAAEREKAEELRRQQVEERLQAEMEQQARDEAEYWSNAMQEAERIQKSREEALKAKQEEAQRAVALQDIGNQCLPTPAADDEIPAVEFHFSNLQLDQIDAGVFKEELVDSLRRLGAPTELLSQLRVQLRAGSVVARVFGSESNLNALSILPLQGNVVVMGDTATIMTAPRSSKQVKSLKDNSNILSEELLNRASEVAQAVATKQLSEGSIKDMVSKEILKALAQAGIPPDVQGSEKRASTTDSADAPTVSLAAFEDLPLLKSLRPRDLNKIIRLQAHLRGYLLRKSMRRHDDKANTGEGSCARAQQASNHAAADPYRKFSTFSFVEHNRNIIKIQCSVRGYLARKKYRELKCKNVEEKQKKKKDDDAQQKQHSELLATSVANNSLSAEQTIAQLAKRLEAQGLNPALAARAAEAAVTETRIPSVRPPTSSVPLQDKTDQDQKADDVSEEAIGIYADTNWRESINSATGLSSDVRQQVREQAIEKCKAEGVSPTVAESIMQAVDLEFPSLEMFASAEHQIIKIQAHTRGFLARSSLVAKPNSLASELHGRLHTGGYSSSEANEAVEKFLHDIPTRDIGADDYTGLVKVQALARGYLVRNGAQSVVTQRLIHEGVQLDVAETIAEEAVMPYVDLLNFLQTDRPAVDNETISQEKLQRYLQLVDSHAVAGPDAAASAVEAHRAQWVNTFESVQSASPLNDCKKKGSDGEDSHCKRIACLGFESAMRSLHPQLSYGQVHALWAAHKKGASSDTMDCSTFCGIVEAVALGGDYICEYADMSSERFESLELVSDLASTALIYSLTEESIEKVIKLQANIRGSLVRKSLTNMPYSSTGGGSGTFDLGKQRSSKKVELQQSKSSTLQRKHAIAVRVQTELRKWIARQKVLARKMDIVHPRCLVPVVPEAQCCSRHQDLEIAASTETTTFDPELETAALRIQTRYRSQIARGKVRSKREEALLAKQQQEAATRIQSSFRRSLAMGAVRERLVDLVQEGGADQELEATALRMQRKSHSHMARRQTRTKQEAVKERKQDAATRIQSSYRRSLALKQVEQDLRSDAKKKVDERLGDIVHKGNVATANSGENELETAALRIQSKYRGRTTRAQLQANQEAIKKRRQEATMKAVDESGTNTVCEGDVALSSAGKEFETAALRIQNKYRARVAKGQMRTQAAIAKRERDAATRIQTSFRKSLAMKEVDRMKRIPEGNEAEDRSCDSGGQVTTNPEASAASQEQMEEAAMRIQSFVRMSFAIRDVKLRREELMQAVHPTLAGHKEVIDRELQQQGHKYEKEFGTAAVCTTAIPEQEEFKQAEHPALVGHKEAINRDLQQHDSRYGCRDSNHELKAAVRYGDHELDAAATRIQAAHHGSTATREFDSKREAGRLAEEECARVTTKKHETAAVRIQSHQRGRVARARVRSKQEEVRFEKQEQEQEADARSAEKECETAALCIQSRYRGRIARGKVRSKREEALLKKREQEANMSRAEKERETAAICIQSQYRGRIARGKVRSKQEEALLEKREQEAAMRLAEKERETAAICIQSQYRGRIARGKVRSKQEEALLAKREEEADKERETAALCIQSQYRGCIARGKVRAKREEAILKTREQEADARLAEKERETAAVCIQSQYRGRLARGQVRSKQEEALLKKQEQEAEMRLAEKNRETAAVCIQSQYRGRMARGKVRSKREEALLKKREQEAAMRRADEERENAAIRIQSQYRGRMARGKVRSKREEALSKKREQEAAMRLADEERETAAVCIQSQYRGRMARGKVRSKQEEALLKKREQEAAMRLADEERETAAVCIQSHQRGRLARGKVRLKREAEMRLAEKERETAAVCIQSQYRGRLARGEVRSKREEALLEKREQEANMRRAEKERETAAICIQSQYRGRMARGKVRSKREEALLAKREEEAEKERETAAICIQSYQRGRIARERVRSKREEVLSAKREQEAAMRLAEKERETAAVCIQSHQRGQVARGKVRSRREETLRREREAAAVRLAEKEKERRRRQEHAALQVQSAQRGRIARKRVATQRDGLRKNAAATCIQTAERCRTAKKKVRLRQEERRSKNKENTKAYLTKVFCKVLQRLELKLNLRLAQADLLAVYRSAASAIQDRATSTLGMTVLHNAYQSAVLRLAQQSQNTSDDQPSAERGSIAAAARSADEYPNKPIISDSHTPASYKAQPESIRAWNILLDACHEDRLARVLLEFDRSPGQAPASSQAQPESIRAWNTLLAACDDDRLASVLLGFDRLPEVLTTQLVEDVAAGSTVMLVTTTAGFAVGDQILIESRAGSETNWIKCFSSIILEHPLKYTHPAGTIIKKLKLNDQQVQGTLFNRFPSTDLEEVDASPKALARACIRSTLKSLKVSSLMRQPDDMVQESIQSKAEDMAVQQKLEQEVPLQKQQKARSSAEFSLAASYVSALAVSVCQRLSTPELPSINIQEASTGRSLHSNMLSVKLRIQTALRSAAQSKEMACAVSTVAGDAGACKAISEEVQAILPVVYSTAIQQVQAMLATVHSEAIQLPQVQAMLAAVYSTAAQKAYTASLQFQEPLPAAINQSASHEPPPLLLEDDNNDNDDDDDDNTLDDNKGLCLSSPRQKEPLAAANNQTASHEPPPLLLEDDNKGNDDDDDDDDLDDEKGLRLDSLRQKVYGTFTSAYDSGKLEKVLSYLAVEKSKKKPPDENDEQEEKPVDVASLRLKAFSRFAGALDSGELDQAFRTIRMAAREDIPVVSKKPEAKPSNCRPCFTEVPPPVPTLADVASRVSSRAEMAKAVAAKAVAARAKATKAVADARRTEKEASAVEARSRAALEQAAAVAEAKRKEDEEIARKATEEKAAAAAKAKRKEDEEIARKATEEKAAAEQQKFNEGAHRNLVKKLAGEVANKLIAAARKDIIEEAAEKVAKNQALITAKKKVDWEKPEKAAREKAGNVVPRTSPDKNTKAEIEETAEEELNVLMKEHDSILDKIEETRERLSQLSDGSDRERIADTVNLLEIVEGAQLALANELNLILEKISSVEEERASVLHSMSKEQSQSCSPQDRCSRESLLQTQAAALEQVVCAEKSRLQLLAGMAEEKLMLQRQVSKLPDLEDANGCYLTEALRLQAEQDEKEPFTEKQNTAWEEVSHAQHQRAHWLSKRISALQELQRKRTELAQAHERDKIHLEVSIREVEEIYTAKEALAQQVDSTLVQVSKVSRELIQLNMDMGLALDELMAQRAKLAQAPEEDLSNIEGDLHRLETVMEIKEMYYLDREAALETISQSEREKHACQKESFRIISKVEAEQEELALTDHGHVQSHTSITRWQAHKQFDKTLEAQLDLVKELLVPLEQMSRAGREMATIYEERQKAAELRLESDQSASGIGAQELLRAQTEIDKGRAMYEQQKRQLRNFTSVELAAADEAAFLRVLDQAQTSSEGLDQAMLIEAQRSLLDSMTTGDSSELKIDLAEDQEALVEQNVQDKLAMCEAVEELEEARSTFFRARGSERDRMEATVKQLEKEVEERNLSY